jgi:hypothetical protein
VPLTPELSGENRIGILPMPLRRPISTQADIVDDSNLLVGVRFTMFYGETRVICRASYEALTDRAKADDVSETTRETFMRYRDRIEEIASANYDDGENPPVVKSHELTQG